MQPIELRLQPARLQPPVGHPPFHAWTFPDGTLWAEFHRAEGGYLLRFPELADFRIAVDARAATCCVTCFPAPAVPAGTTQHLYLNQVLPLVLSKLGKLVFHASAVEIDGGAVAFVGESGRGKSTLAASFAVSGCRFLTDDGLVVEPRGQGFQALPSHPSIRLWEDSEAALIPPAARRAPPVHYTAKARFLADDALAFCALPRPLRRVYFLGDGLGEGLGEGLGDGLGDGLGEGDTEQIKLQRLSPAETVVEWVKHSFLLDIEEQPRLASHFDQVATLAKQPIHYRLDYPRRFDQLAAVRRSILAHAHQADDGV